jgi:hypothetical protein
VIAATRRAYLTLWAATALAAGAASAGVTVIGAGAPRDALAATPPTAIELLAHNCPVALWPLALVGLGWPAIPGARRAGDVLIAAQLLGHAALVGGALGAHPGMWRYLPHLPLEWLALALPTGGWLAARRHGAIPIATAARLAGLTVGVLGLAAVIETYLVPL